MSEQRNNEKHWILEQEEGIAWAWLDRQGASANTLNQEVMLELDALLNDIQSNATIKCLVFGSKKKSGFIAGADITQFLAIKNFEQGKRVIDTGQAIFNKIETLSIPTIAMIEGFCFGGGLELALACRYRIAEDSAKTKLGLPEVKLGIQPGWGGTVRLPRLIGIIQAMGLMLTGRAITAKAAKRMGFVDEAVPKRQLRRAVLSYAKQPPKPARATRFQRWMDCAFIRPLLAWQMRKNVQKQAKQEHYPAPYAIINNWLEHGVYADAALSAEADSITQLFLTETSRNLVSVFFLQEKLKGLGKHAKFKPKHVHIIGAGVMGGDIAAWFAFRGVTVTLQDREASCLSGAMKRAHALFKKKYKRDRYGMMAALDRLIPDVAGRGIARADLIVEAIYENLGAKQALFKEIEAKAKSNAILATNTSGILIDQINAVLSQPERLVGIHFFNPVVKMPLVEIVIGEKTSDDVVRDAMGVVNSIGKLPLPVKSHPGFLVNRVLMPCLIEAMVLLDEGYPKSKIDQLAKQFGMPMGPIELADTVGLDVCLSVAKNLAEHFGTEVPSRLQAQVDTGRLGRKTKQGFYDYKNGQPVCEKEDSTLKLDDVVDRLILRMLNEAAACLREGIVADTEQLDAGMVFGTGFAPFRGGVSAYACSFTEKDLFDRLNTLADRYGERFKPDEGIRQLRETQRVENH